MSDLNDKAFGGDWDLGQEIIEELISYPISHMIREVAEDSGIDLSNPIRSLVSIMASGLMSTVVGSFLGPFGGIISGLMGETLGLSASYPGDRTRQERELQEKAWVMLRVKALTMALEITKEHTSRDTWNAIVDETQRRINQLGTHVSTEREALNIGIEICTNSIYKVDRTVYRNFDKVYRTTKRTLGV